MISSTIVNFLLVIGVGRRRDKTSKKKKEEDRL
jgi:hypothetical protein